MEVRRTNFLRMRLAATAGGLGITAVGLLPWLVLWAVVSAAGGTLLVILAVACVAWGLLFIPLLWLGLQVLRLAWHPLAQWRPLRQRFVETSGRER